ncbi:hypothetical protein [Arenimonas composti]|uniref:Uncharacterized protein n=1 Tax=Arenimonas composti TR7-09 = DSM 18010 TaxID=1121013 RepID=A0A091BJ33_9GAMM|nr:hypothetical protein [Arenimonas composti]KFN50794.1 hypothetical protein P873_05055 [Arenimonas composti TR7-09 = DSM 18010]
MKGRRAWLALGAAAALLVAWGIRTALPPDARADDARTGPPIAAESAGGSAARTAPDEAGAAPPMAGHAIGLPPQSTAPDVVVALLHDRAEAGDVHAACRVWIALLGCRVAAEYTRALATRESFVPPDVPDEYLEQQDRSELATLAYHEACMAIPPAIHARADDYLTRAARAGVTEAMLHYVDGRHLHRQKTYDWLNHPGLDAWRRDAPAMLQRLLESGTPEAVFLYLVTSDGPDFGLLAGIIPNDPERALAYRLLLRRLSGRRDDPPGVSNSPPDRLVRARALAASMHARHFGDRVYSPDEITTRLASGLVPWPDTAATRTPCQDEPVPLPSR